jgi:thiol-disulfide isomerase/thioredoxin
MAELQRSLHRFALRLLPVVCLLCLPGFALAQSSENSCEPSAAIKEDFRKLAAIDDEALPYRTRRDRQSAMLQELLKKYPNDFHVQRRNQIHRQSGFFVDRDALLAEYRDQMQKSPNDPQATYLYARLLIGRGTKEAIALSQKLAQQSPDFPWAHIQLAEIYTYANFRDPAKSNEHLKQWIAKCPSTIHGIGFITRSGDKEMMTTAAQRVRARLEASTEIDDLGYWDDLWTLEFKLKPVAQHPEVRKQIAEDLKRIRQNNQVTKLQLETLAEGYKQVADKTGQRWAEDELIRLMPKSETARRLITSRYNDEHPYPKPEEPEAKKQAHNQAVVQVTDEWIKQWPHDDNTWSTRVRSLAALENSSNTDVEAAYNGYAKARELGGGWYSIPPLEIGIARVYLKRGFRLENVPAMILKGVKEVEEFEKSRGGTDLVTLPPDTVFGNMKYMRMEALPLLAEAYARLKQPDKARETLAQLTEVTSQKEQTTDAQRRTFAHGQFVYWQAAGKVAEIEQRKLDAMTAYQTALAFRITKPAGKDELSDNTQRLWKELGGTDQGWQAYLARNESPKGKLGTAEVSTWDTKKTAMSDFELPDLEGRKWSLADLKGKVAFINLWATWCGPCRVELPYVQKLREQMKDRKDVLVLTLNTDEDVGMVEPFMKENKYTFPVLLGEAYAEKQGVNSIPRNWIVSSEGRLMFEGIGFGNNGEEWLKKAVQLIEQVKSAN